MMKNKTGCVVCGKELIYFSTPRQVTCTQCGQVFMESVQCAAGHYVCNACHQSVTCDLISSFCNATNQTNPIEMAITLMNNPRFQMHGPEHHFLVPAVLLAAYHNLKKTPELKQNQLELARHRAEQILGGFCGSHGTCGAGVGTGIFYSVLTHATPLTSQPWQFSNLITGSCLVKIAEKGGPRCCKRDSFTAIEHTVDFMKQHHDIELPSPEKVTCNFHSLNNECLQTGCAYFPA